MSLADVKKNAQERMTKSIETLRADLAKVRTGRAHTGILDHVMVDYYGSPTPLTGVANLTLADARTIASKPLKPGKTWRDSHTPCIGCHAKDRCRHCHYDSTPPPTHAQRAVTKPAAVAITAPATQPSTRALIMRIRR